MLLAAGVLLLLLAVVTGILKTPFGFSNVPVWIIFAANGGIALVGFGMLFVASNSAH